MKRVFWLCSIVSLAIFLVPWSAFAAQLMHISNTCMASPDVCGACHQNPLWPAQELCMDCHDNYSGGGIPG